jgi:hypothetical protein
MQVDGMLLPMGEVTDEFHVLCRGRCDFKGLRHAAGSRGRDIFDIHGYMLFYVKIFQWDTLNQIIFVMYILIRSFALLFASSGD